MKTKTVRLDDDVRDVLVRSTILRDRVVLPQGQLNRELYGRVDKVLRAAGGKWNRKARAHLFPHDPRPLLGDLRTVEKVVHKQQTFQQFLTPEAVARRLVWWALGPAKPTSVLSWLEPSAGSGNVVEAIIEVAKVVPACVEIEPISAKSLRDRRFVCNDCASVRVLVQEEDFLTFGKNETFDRIVMNPPWTRGQDILHVTHAWNLLKCSGILVAIVSPSALTGTQKKHKAFQKLVAEYGEVLEELPRGTFADTDVAAKVIRLVAPPF